MGWGKVLQSCSKCTRCLARSCTSACAACTSMGNPLLQPPFLSPLTFKGWLVNPCCRSAIEHATHPSAPQPFFDMLRYKEIVRHVPARHPRSRTAKPPVDLLCWHSENHFLSVLSTHMGKRYFLTVLSPQLNGK